MPKLTIDSGLKAKCPCVALGLLVAQVTTHDTTAAFLEEMKCREKEILTSPEPRAILESPTILSTRAGYKALGKDPSRYRGSAEALLRRIISGKGFPQINTVVDIVNLVCVESRLPIGMYDLANVEGNVVFRVGRPGESYRGIGKFDLNLEGLSVLSDEAGPHGSPTRDSERTMVTSSTKHGIAIVISFGGMECLEFAGERMTALLRQHADGRHIQYKIIS
jgi:DNA/RNA-binding domain of Phe-tRNA-synthetase-like protein